MYCVLFSNSLADGKEYQFWCQDLRMKVLERKQQTSNAIEHMDLQFRFLKKCNSIVIARRLLKLLKNHGDDSISALSSTILAVA